LIVTATQADRIGPALLAHRRAQDPVQPVLDGLSDEALMRRYQSGDGAAFELLYRRHSGRLHRFVTRMTSGGAEADEIFQEVWLAIIKGRERYVPSARFVTFLFSIAHRRAADRLRFAHTHPTEELDAEYNDTTDTPLDTVLNAALGHALQAAIATLPLPQREAFLLQAEAELSLDEISQAAGVPRETVKSRLRYAHRRLRQALDEWK